MLVMLASALAGCGGSVSGGEQTVIDTASNISGATLRVNNVSGSDTADGLNAPYQSLQYALDQLRPGDVLLIEDSGQPYSTNNIVGEERDVNGDLLRTLRGFTIKTSGTDALPIVIAGQATGRPEINQQQTSSVPGDAVLGLLLDCVSHIVIRNLEIRNANEAGISSSTDGACQTSNITIEDNHIHNIFGAKMVGGIRMMGVSDLVVRGNTISDIYSNLSNEAKVMIKAGRGISNIVVENNQLRSLDSGIVMNAQGLGSSTFSLANTEAVSNLKISGNTFYQTKHAINFQTHITDASATDEVKTGAYSAVDLFGNVFNQVDSAILAELGASESQSGSFCMFNNTVVATQLAAVDVSGIIDLELFNNIYAMPQGPLLETRSPTNTTLRNSIAYSNNNLFWNFSLLSWQLDSGGVSASTYPDLANWQFASSHPELATDPDMESMITDPQFIDPFTENFALSVTSPALLAGRYDMSIGADFSLPLNFLSNCRSSL